MRNTGRSIGRWSLALWLLLCLFLALAVSGELSANETTPENSQTSIFSHYNSLKENAKKLSDLLQKREEKLDGALNLLANSRESLASSILDNQKLTISLEQSDATLTESVENFGEYQSSTSAQIRRLNIERWIYRGVLALIAIFEAWRALKSP